LEELERSLPVRVKRGDLAVDKVFARNETVMVQELVSEFRLDVPSIHGDPAILRTEEIKMFLGEMLKAKDTDKTHRMLKALWQMQKLDVKRLKAAFDGRE
jgi:hypothetical protein